jgi:hypothetical protein
MLDLVWTVPTFILAIVMAAKEGQVTNSNLLFLNIISQGAFASASVTALISIL